MPGANVFWRERAVTHESQRWKQEFQFFVEVYPSVFKKQVAKSRSVSRELSVVEAVQRVA